jgi:diaminohydroxyphosphoribosylaminopyrimidine deaminase/5-amino-6-(5-phosphoribosylamino)uracil reductase
MNHHNFMQIALRLANRGLGLTAPNPSVGCVIVKNNQIIATGITGIGGRPHAETIALSKAGKDAEGATVYVTLEPCSHFGKTPPCADALISAKVKTVVIAVQDPFAVVNGGGITKLKNNGIEVITGICEDEARELNRGFFTVQAKKRPYVTLKLAISGDGKIATSWITNKQAKNYAHLLRAKNDAIMVGISTVLADDPELTCRLSGMENQSPIRVVVDNNLRIPDDSKLVQTAGQIPVWILTTETSQKSGVKTLTCQKNGDYVDLSDALTKLAENDITRLLVEGGGKIATSLIEQNLVDELILIKSPEIVGNAGITAILPIVRMTLQSDKNLGDNIAEIYHPKLV